MNLNTWLVFLAQAAGLAALAGAIFGAVAGAVLASPAGVRPWQGLAVGSLLPVFGLTVLAIMALVRRKPSSRPALRTAWHLRTKAGVLVFVSLALLFALAVAGFFVSWFTLRLPGVPRLNVRAPGSFLGVTLGCSLLLIVVAGLLSARRPSRIAPVVLAGVGTAWLFLSGVVLAIQVPAFELAKSLGALRFTVGDILSLAGVDTSSAVVVLPDSINPAALGLASARLSPSDMNLASPLRDINLGVGTGWYLMLVFALGVVVLATATAQLACKHYANPAEAAQSPTRPLAADEMHPSTSVAGGTSDTASGSTWTWNAPE